VGDGGCHDKTISMEVGESHQKDREKEIIIIVEKMLIELFVNGGGAGKICQ